MCKQVSVSAEFDYKVSNASEHEWLDGTCDNILQKFIFSFHKNKI